jgi:hypothetical protein
MVADGDGHDAPPALHVLDANEHSAEIAQLLVNAGLDLAALTPTSEDLESYFLRLTGGTS